MKIIVVGIVFILVLYFISMFDTSPCAYCNHPLNTHSSQNGCPECGCFKLK